MWMRTMGKHSIKVIYSIEEFVNFTEMDFGRTLVVLFQLLPLVLGGLGCGIRNRK